MKKKAVKYALWAILAIVIILTIINVYNWIVCGNQYIKINTANTAQANSDLNIAIIAQDKGVDLETKTKLKLLNSKGKKVKDVKVSYDKNNATISIPEVEAGTYFIEAKVSSKAGKDTIEKEIYISEANKENINITLDKGIYKPGDTVNFRALLTDKENDEPVEKEVNVSIYDGNDNKVYNENVKTSDYGILSGNFKLANEVNSGVYKIIVKTKTNETTKQFKVNPYVTPKYEVKIAYNKENYLVGDTANININAKYFFGEVAKGTKFAVYIDNKKYKDFTADEQGNAKFEYKIEQAKTYNVKVEAVDSSNYFVEQTSSFTAGTDIFEIELLPEYGTLVEGRSNDIYVFTKKPDGAPLKTYITVSSDKFTKQVATDENGIGKFSIDIEQTQTRRNYRYLDTDKTETKEFNVSAEDMDKKKKKKNVSLKTETKELLLKTDKAKYEQGEDIKLNISSITESTKNIYFFKNDKLIKMLSTETEESSINLDDTYGLIDIYVTEQTTQNGNDYYRTNIYNQTKTYKKTIFIKPTKQLNIAINTDKQEYKPGENISISFNTTNENQNSVDAALLVSMLDNSVLNLADNDLSIDNIKTALSDIKFSDDLDAATLYSCIVNDASEQTIMALLLKQSDRDIKVSETIEKNTEQKEMAGAIAIILTVVIVISVIMALSIKFPKFEKVVKHIINFVMFDIILMLVYRCISDEFYLDMEWISVIITTIIGLIIYILWISKIVDKTFRTSISNIIAVLAYTIIWFLVTELTISVVWIALAAAILALICVVLAKVADAKKLKINKYTKLIVKEIIYILKYVGAIIISVIIGSIIEAITNIYYINFPISITGIYVLNYFFNRIGKKENKVKEKPRTVKSYVVVVLAIIGILAIGNIVIKVIRDSQIVILNNGYNMIDRPIRNNNGSGLVPSDFSGATADTQAIESSKGSTSTILDGIFSSTKDAINSSGMPKTDTTNEVTEEAKPNIVTDNKIRNVFLESMCFVPELVTTNGQAKLDLTLSDNITTWTIQTVGNTKDGRLGYGKLDNIKVFKEFFVDFELPKNSVETDKVSIPVTVHNYTENAISTTLKIKEEEWFSLESKNINVNVSAKNYAMVYVPITILKSGENKFRIEIESNGLTDIVEKQFTVEPKGYKVEKVVSAGTIEKNISEDILMLEDVIENTGNVKVKIYANTMSQTVEGMENIFRMPTGCFEQISSSLYPNILALKYLEDNKITNEEIKQKALNYISSGYQKLLTYEVKGESGGYSLYGKSPAETVLTAYGLMEITDLKEVYNVDEKVIEKMTNFLYKKQKSNGTFEITGNHLGGASSRETLSLNAYITWALSESNPKDERLQKSVKYLKDKIGDIDDNYTLALIANVLANVEDKQLNNVLKRLVNNVNVNGNVAYLTSNVTDYYGARADVQTVQTVALTSMALTKASYNQEMNKSLINYLISRKDTKGTWYSTQATILALKALNEKNDKAKLDNQTITVKVNSEEQKIEIKDNPIELYELNFKNIEKENKLNINMEKGNAYYEIVEEYYIPYEKVDTSKDNIEISVEANKNLKVNDVMDAKFRAINKSKNNISNGMVTIDIPQGFTVIEDSLMLLETKGIIEKYEMTYSKINLYLRNFADSQIVEGAIQFRASYPVEITGLAIRAYDYYNPEVEGRTMPIEINVTK